ncbi:MAG: hypothetical protein K8J31_15620 [Anaerolineae bacterium]|nr:hypothetical protein [Anaerolineae bacterium]
MVHWIHWLWLFLLPVAGVLPQDKACQNVIVRSETVNEQVNCPAPVTTYLSEADDGWHIDIWNNAAVNDQSLLAVTVLSDAVLSESTTLLGTYDRPGLNVLLYQLDTGEFEVLAGPDAQGQMFDLIFSLPPNGQEKRQDFLIAE